LDLIARVERHGLLAASRQLAVRDDPFTLGADIDQHLVWVDADNHSVDDVTVGQSPDRVAVLLEEVLHGERFGLLDRGDGQRSPFGLFLLPLRPGPDGSGNGRRPANDRTWGTRLARLLHCHCDARSLAPRSYSPPFAVSLQRVAAPATAVPAARRRTRA